MVAAPLAVVPGLNVPAVAVHRTPVLAASLVRVAVKVVVLPIRTDAVAGVTVT